MAKFKIRVNKDESIKEADKIIIGSKSTCDVSIEDPIVRDEHCAIIAAVDGFMLEDLNTSSGTYLNGAATRGRVLLPAAADIVVGVTRLKIKVTKDGETPMLELQTSERDAFYFDRKEDLKAWSKEEVRFGRFRPVSATNWFAVLGVLLIVPICFIGTPSDRILDPGPLKESRAKDFRAAAFGGVADSAHASRTFHADVHGKAYEKALLELPEDERGCEACHDPFNGTPVEKCARCHADIANGDLEKGGRHPVGNDPNRWAVGCLHCHVEHRGAHTEALISLQAPETCGACHEVDKPLTKDRRAAVVNTNTDLFYNTFAHADHKEKTACTDCHKIGTPSPKTPENAREFAPVVYTQCMDCHGPNASHPKKSEKRYEMTWESHGAKKKPEQCLACHAETYKKDLRQVEFTRVDRLYKFASRPHKDEFVAMSKDGQKDRCDLCHKNGEELAGGRPMQGRLFEHGTHVSQLLDRHASNPDVSAKECEHCHSSRSKSADLKPIENESGFFVLDRCTKCHTGTVDKPVEQKRYDTVKRADFPHDKHQKVDGGCFACHKFTGAPAWNALPVTPDEVKDCTSCHSTHKNIGTEHSGDAGCAKCHKEKDPVYSNQPIVWTRPQDLTFSHYSPGHVKPTTAGDCKSCHHDEKTWAAKVLTDIPVPSEADASCRNCHVQQKARFHWR